MRQPSAVILGQVASHWRLMRGCLVCGGVGQRERGAAAW